MALWFCLGIRLHRGVVIFVALLLLYHLGLLLALLPYFEEPDKFVSVTNDFLGTP